MKTRVSMAAGALLLLAVAYLHSQQFGSQPAKLNLVKVKDDLVLIHNPFVPGNTTALVTSEGEVLVDDKFEVDALDILAMLKTVTNQPVRYVINTHHHGDHSGGNARMQATGAQVIASEAAFRHFVDGKQPGPPTVTFVDRALIHLGGQEVRLCTSDARRSSAAVFSAVESCG
jgi:glyoxylase-like metal-dependent hydrolase (beta-lactamase superfamily II)